MAGNKENEIMLPNEFNNLRSQFGTSSLGAFTEQGVAMLLSVLNSDREELEQLK